MPGESSQFIYMRVHYYKVAGRTRDDNHQWINLSKTFLHKLKVRATPGPFLLHLIMHIESHIALVMVSCCSPQEKMIQNYKNLFYNDRYGLKSSLSIIKWGVLFYLTLDEHHMLCVRRLESSRKWKCITRNVIVVALLLYGGWILHGDDFTNKKNTLNCKRKRIFPEIEDEDRLDFFLQKNAR
jgi:hypothetical protein